MKLGENMKTFKCDECEGGPCTISINNKRGDCGRYNREVSKEPELMTLEEAIGKVKDDEKVRHISWTDDKYFLRHGLNAIEPVVSVWEAVEMKWQIIPAEPKVLTAEEILGRYLPRSQMHGGGPREYKDDDCIYIIGQADQNGQLKQWLNHKELRETFTELLEKTKRYMRNPAGNDFTIFIRASEAAIKNLKPL